MNWLKIRLSLSFIILELILFSYQEVRGEIVLSSNQSPNIQFVFPDVVAPNRFGSGGLRGYGCPSLTMKTLTALMPTVQEQNGFKKLYGLTTNGYPTFFFSIPESEVTKDLTAEFTIYDESGDVIDIQSFSLQKKSGILTVQFPLEKPPLAINQVIDWEFNLICNREDRASDLFINGQTKRIELSPDLQQQFNKAKIAEQITLYANNGIWHDSIALLAQMRDQNPEETRWVEQWHNLLESVGLAYVADIPLIESLDISLSEVEETELISPERVEAGKLFQEGRRSYQEGELQKALIHWQKALQLYQQLDHKELEAKTLTNLGLVEYGLGNYINAIGNYQTSLPLSEAINDPRTQGRTLGNLGLAYDALGETQTAIGYYQQSLTLAQQVSDPYGEAKAWGNLGSVYFALGDYQKAQEAQQKSWQLMEKIDDIYGQGEALNQLGLVASALGNSQESIDFYEKSLTLIEQSSDRKTQAQVLNNLGLSYLLIQQYPKAIAYFKQSLVITQEIEDRLGTGLSLNNLGFAYLEKREFSTAQNYLQKGIEVWEALRTELGDNDTYKIAIFEQQSRTYQLLQKVLVAQNKPERALEIAERGRTQAWIDLFSQKVNPSSAQINTQPLTQQDIQKIAQQQNATLVEYSLVDSTLYIWVIQPEGKIIFRPVDLSILDLSLEQTAEFTRVAAATGRQRGEETQNSPFNQWVRGTRESLEMERIETNHRLQKSYQLLIKPIVDLLPNDPNAQIIFIPHQSLFLIPFAALQNEEGNYLIENHTLSIAPSIKVLALTHQHQQQLEEKQPYQSLVVGNPLMPSIPQGFEQSPQPLNQLTGAEAEAIKVAKFLETQPLIGENATEATIKQKLPQARLIHLATHGLLNELKHLNLGMPGAVALTPTAKEDGLLTSEEIINLSLNAELVVLSACNTGRGEITGDGVIGLSRAFITAGSSSVIVSLWLVPDQATNILMQAFYQELQGNPNKAQALRQAMLTTIKQYPNPLNWSAFLLMGQS